MRTLFNIKLSKEEPLRFSLMGVDKGEQSEEIDKIIRDDLIYKRLTADKDKFDLQRKRQARLAGKSRERIAELRKEKNALKRKITGIDRQIERTKKHKDIHEIKYRAAVKAFNHSISGIRSRRIELVHYAKSELLKVAYREIGLPMPRKLKRIRSLAVFARASMDYLEEANQINAKSFNKKRRLERENENETNTGTPESGGAHNPETTG